MPVIGALIGWTTNLLAVRLLFRPYRPVRLPLLGYRFQGMLPKYRFELAKKVGHLMQSELVPIDSLLDKLHSEEVRKELTHLAEMVVRGRVLDRLPPFLPLSIKRLIGDLIAEQVHKELPALLNELFIRSGQKIKEEFELAQIIEEKLSALELPQLENIVYQVAGRELRYIEILGGIIGFLIGLLQAGLILLFNVNGL